MRTMTTGVAAGGILSGLSDAAVVGSYEHGGRPGQGLSGPGRVRRFPRGPACTMSVYHRFHPRLRDAIASRLGWKSLRPVQEQAGELILGGGNGVVLAPTAGGKTEASFFPVLSGLLSDEPVGLAALYIAPIKALINNQAERLATYFRMVGLDRFVWHGDTPWNARRGFLAEPRALLMTTPESLEVMLVSTRVDATSLFSDLRAVVIDEVHAMAGTDRGAHLMSVLERVVRLSRHDVQRIGLSATVGNPERIRAWLQGTSLRPSRVVDPPHPPARRELLVLHRDEQELLALDAAKLVRGRKSLTFCQSRSTTEAVAQTMRRAGTAVFVHHSSVSLEERQAAEQRFHQGSDACIVCTSTLELGIDVGDLDRVVQIDAPDTVASFLQRMGRTGRRPGSAANTTFACETRDAVLQAVALVELARRGWVEHVGGSDRCWPVLVHQLLAMSLAQAGVTPSEAWAHLSRVPDFQGIERPEFERLIAWMLRDTSLEEVGGRLVFGHKAERLYGRRNYMELYAVFESPVAYQVVLHASKRPIGSLGQAFVDRLVEQASTFVLGGRSWRVLEIDHTAKEIGVSPAPLGRRPTWGGFTPQFLSFEICQEIRRHLVAHELPAYLHASAAAVLSSACEDFVEALTADGRMDLEDAEGEWRWWTFAGGRINQTLRAALEAIGGDWKVLADNFAVKVRGCDHRRLLVETIETLSDTEFWEDERLWREVAEGLPGYRLSKFQPVLPPWAEREMLAAYLLDIEGAWRWVTGKSADAVLGLGRLAFEESVELPAVEPTRVVGAHRPRRPVHWVSEAGALASLCSELRGGAVVALDVETTLGQRQLCLVQLGTAEASYLIDPLSIADLSPLAELLADASVLKLIHYASFERSVLGQLGMSIEPVCDTHRLSKELRGRVDGGHSLAAVCGRELGIVLEKGEQVSDWRRRPLSAAQRDYAAVDVEVLIDLHGKLGGERQGVLPTG